MILSSGNFSSTSYTPIPNKGFRTSNKSKILPGSPKWTGRALKQETRFFDLPRIHLGFVSANSSWTSKVRCRRWTSKSRRDSAARFLKPLNMCVPRAKKCWPWISRLFLPKCWSQRTTWRSTRSTPKRPTYQLLCSIRITQLKLFALKLTPPRRGEKTSRTWVGREKGRQRKAWQSRQVIIFY